MILVLLGTQDKSFHRLLEAVEEQITKGRIEEEVVAQIGYTNFVSSKMKCVSFLSALEIQELEQQASLVITHGGVGSIIECLKCDKKVIVVPRRKEYKEHTNNHQLQIAQEFWKRGHVLYCEQVSQLGNMIEVAKTFCPIPYIGGNQQMIDIIESYIEGEKKAKMETKEQVVIAVSHVYKDFKVYFDRANTLKEKLLFWRRNRKEVRHILKDVSFDIHKGESVSLIGVNGSGKSTLLKLITKILYPTKGKITTTGKVTSLLELGAGFHPDFTGRENIYFNASIFGLTRKEIEDRIPDIIAFSELNDYIDNPVRTYSSGMYMRLAFSIAINVNAEILLIDEILAVGDQHFQEKCYAKMEELKKTGITIVLVTHDMRAVREFSDRAVWLRDGVVYLDGPSSEVVSQYLKEQG